MWNEARIHRLSRVLRNEASPGPNHHRSRDKRKGRKQDQLRKRGLRGRRRPRAHPTVLLNSIKASIKSTRIRKRTITRITEKFEP